MLNCPFSSRNLDSGREGKWLKSMPEGSYELHRYGKRDYNGLEHQTRYVGQP